jgi:DNA-binding LacI/PurR family transcriptional regulator
MMTFGTEPEEIYHLAHTVPIVSVYSGVKREVHASISIDFLSGIRHAVQHLAALGHREIGFAGAESQNYSATLRREAFVTAMRELGLIVKAERLFEHHHTFEGGIEAARHVIQLKNRPTALICSNGLIAIGALGVFQHGGLNVPRDISLVGLDDITLAQFTSPPLTTVTLSRRDLARIAFEALRWQFDQSVRRSDMDDRITTSLVIRESTTFASASVRTATRRKVLAPAARA